MVKIYDINSAVVGDDISLDVTVKTSAGVEDVSGSTSYFTIKSDPSVSDASALSQSVGVISGDGSTGLLKFNAPSTDTDSASAEVKYYYDIQVELSSGRKYTLYSGRISFIAGITLA
jgi:hypothetical protein